MDGEGKVVGLLMKRQDSKSFVNKVYHFLVNNC